MAEDTPISSRTAIVTGAGRGIGRAIAVKLSSLGMSVVGVSRTVDDLESLASETGVTIVPGDICDMGVIEAVLDKAPDADTLINCAGIAVLEPLGELTEDGVDAVLNMNLKAPLFFAKAFARQRINKGGGGTILNITSIAGHRGFENHTAYAASKAGLEAATRVMAKELGPHGIVANSIAPTITLTDMARKAWSDPEKSRPMKVRHPVGYFAEPEHVADAVAMMVKEPNPLITGTVIPLDGGFLAV